MEYDDAPTTWANDSEKEYPAEFWNDLPQPLFWRVMVMPVKPREVSKGGIVLARQNVEAQEILNFVGKVVSLGPVAGVHERLGGDGTNPPAGFPKVGDHVIFGRHAGQRLLYRGVKLILVNDDELLGVVPNPDLLHVSI